MALKWLNTTALSLSHVKANMEREKESFAKIGTSLCHLSTVVNN